MAVPDQSGGGGVQAGSGVPSAKSVSAAMASLMSRKLGAWAVVVYAGLWEILPRTVDPTVELVVIVVIGVVTVAYLAAQAAEDVARARSTPTLPGP